MLLATTDLHLSEQPIDLYRFDFLEKHLPHEIKKSQQPVDGLIIAGDITEEKDRHSARLVNRIVNGLSNLAALCPVIVLMGNHDYADEGHPFFEFLGKIENLCFVDTPQFGKHLKEPFKVFRYLLFLPHTRDYKRDWATYLNYGWGDLDAIIAHNTFDGADTGYGRKLDGIPVDIFGKQAVFAGDIHNPQQLGPVEYIGAPYTVDFGDDYAARLLCIQDNGKTRWRAIDHYPQKRLVHVCDGKDLLDYNDRWNEGDILKVRVDVDNMREWGSIVKLVHAQAAKLGVIASRVEPVIAGKAQKKSVKAQTSESNFSDKEIVTQFADRNNLDDETLDAGLALLEEKP